MAEDLVNVDELDGGVDLAACLLEAGSPRHEGAPHVLLLRVVPRDAELRLLKQVPRVRLGEARNPRRPPLPGPRQGVPRGQDDGPRLQLVSR